MKTIDKKFIPHTTALDAYPVERLFEDPRTVLFIDIETSGLSVRNSYIYLIGCACQCEDGYHLHQWFSDDISDEAQLLTAFFSFAKSFHTLISFNGNRFDLPFIRSRCGHYGISDVLDKFDSFDIYRKFVPLRNILGLPDCRQITVEHALGINRTSYISGDALVNMFKACSKEHGTAQQEALLEHNADDIRYMLDLLNVQYYSDFINSVKKAPTLQINCDAVCPKGDFALPVNATHVQADYYSDYNGNTRQELFMKISFPYSFTAPINANADGCFCSLSGSIGTLRIPITECEMKYFYSDFKNYYFLPEEDQALHKSVAEFVNRSNRVQATAATCYTRKTGQFLPEWDQSFTPVFRKEYKDSIMYFELTDNIKKSRTAMSLYASHVLSHLFPDI